MKKPTMIPLIAAALVGACGLAHAAPSLVDANLAFSQGRHQQAAVAFEALIKEGGWSAPLLYDLANAEAKSGHVGQAVLSYERARWLAPRDPDINANLALLRARAGLSDPPRPWYRVVAERFSINAWTALAVGAVWLAAGAFWLRRRRLPATLSLLAAAAVAISAVAINAKTLDTAVVVNDGALRVAPFDTAAIEATTKVGEEVSVIGRHHDFVRVHNGEGRTGWIESTSLQLIVPEPRRI